MYSNNIANLITMQSRSSPTFIDQVIGNSEIKLDLLHWDISDHDPNLVDMKTPLPENHQVYKKRSLSHLLLPEKQSAFLLELINSLSYLSLW